MMKLRLASDIWIFLVANLAAGIVSGLTFRFLNPEDK
jgi:hypothetical protein